jgi:hypothetical protein
MRAEEDRDGFVRNPKWQEPTLLARIWEEIRYILFPPRRRYWNRLKFGSFGSGAPGTSSFGLFSSLRSLTGYRQKPQHAHNMMKPQCQRLRANPAHR